MACLQVCLQHLALRCRHMSQSTERAFVAFADFPQQRLHSELKMQPRTTKLKSEQMTLKMGIRRVTNLRWSAESLKRPSGPVKAYIRVRAPFIRAG